MSQANLRQAVALRSVQILVNAIRNEPKNARKKAVAGEALFAALGKEAE